MKVLICSEARFRKTGIKWIYGGNSIKYQRYFPEHIKENVKVHYALSFCYTFEYNEDVVWFAFSEPYTYSELQSDLLRIERSPKYKKMFARNVLCNSISGLNCDLLTITNLGRNADKKVIVLSARVHPCLLYTSDAADE
eukprot:TRINITY_DN18206_c0_g1_i3.p2 TRINITY_DN18206_c0_g1~~TRINITY_DN18206_c0_g1_i3.p2  ORF type:complete len:139 (+),score=26.17 TRINITY_DN18206_c0_g1_i3:202-618(+)